MGCLIRALVRGGYFSCMCSDACLREYRKRKAGAMMIPAFAYRCIVSALGNVNLEYARIRTS